MPENVPDEQNIEQARQLLAYYSTRQRSMSAQQRFEAAREVACLVAPRWEHIIRRWNGKYVWNLDKPKINGREFAHGNWTIEELTGSIVHMTDHLVMRHKDRKGEREDGPWNIASCLEDAKRWGDIFDSLGIKLPKKIDPRPGREGISRDEAEKLYDQLSADPNSQGDGSGDGNGNDQGDESGQGKPGQGKGQGQGKPGQGQGQPGQGQPGQGQGQPGQGQPGQGQGEACELQNDNFDESMAEQEGPGEPGDGDGSGDGQQNGQPGQPGNSPGDKQLDPHKEEAFLNLARLISKRLLTGGQRRDYSLSRPSNRSSLTNGGVLSSLYKKPEEIRVVVDCSGSLSDQLRNAIFRVVEKIQKSAPDHKVIVAAGDTVIRPEHVGSLKWVLGNLRGGGGTDMEVVFNQAVHHPRMRGGTRWLFITDGESMRWPATLPPNSMVLVVNNDLEGTQKRNVATGTDPYALPTRMGSYAFPEQIRRAGFGITQKEFLTGVKPWQVAASGRDVA